MKPVIPEKTLVLLIGIQGSGKTTFTRAFFPTWAGHGNMLALITTR